MSTKARRHTHKYHKISVAGSKVWGCAHPNCNHYMPKHMESMVVGKNTICWQCGDETVLDADLMTQDKPICHECKSDPLIEMFETRATANDKSSRS